MFLHGGDDVHLAVQLPGSEEFRFPFRFQRLESELRRAARGLWHGFFQIEHVKLLRRETVSENVEGFGWVMLTPLESMRMSPYSPLTTHCWTGRRSTQRNARGAPHSLGPGYRISEGLTLKDLPDPDPQPFRAPDC